MCDRVEYQKLAILVTQEWDRVKLYFPLSNDINFSNLQVLKLSFNYVMLSEVKIIVRILLKYSWKEFKELYINKNNHSINKAICKYCKNIKIINTELTIEALSELDYFFDALPFLESSFFLSGGHYSSMKTVFEKFFIIPGPSTPTESSCWYGRKWPLILNVLTNYC
ncbi:hypothetical protein RCL_jg18650.t1 [Rhizophagus clarus]|uniref:Uncharacterized protein n=1 Tax=Rhizophagus clarus TaxID=94130 RepID=A0A8H3QP14_9GLOM|nr:hypothetical protein RCL_jg18650.t1 [Rhizophagus clarus]